MKTLPGRTAVLTGAVLGAVLNVAPAQAAPDAATPAAQAWIDVATFSGMGMPMGGMAGIGADPASALGGLFGGKSGAGGGNAFGNTRTLSAGRWVDVTVRARAAPGLEEAQQSVPEGFLSPALQLRTPKNAPAPGRDDEEVMREPPEKPRGRMLLYWGCGATIRQGQPRVLDMASASAADYAKFFVARSATQRGAHSAAGRPVWPNPADSRMVPATASLVGEHGFSGAGMPEGFRFKVPPAQDLMPPLVLEQAEKDGVAALSWNAIPTARAYFVAAMGSNAGEDMVMWSSSEVADTGFGLMDYQTNAAVERWLKEKVLLTPATTNCSVPKGIFGEHGGMLRVIAYGDELNLVHPPRPKDPKAKWDPLWAVKWRVKAVTSGMLGMSAAPHERGDAPRERGKAADGDAQGLPATPQPLELLKGIFGR